MIFNLVWFSKLVAASPLKSMMTAFLIPNNSLSCPLQTYDMGIAGVVVYSYGMESCLLMMINPFWKEFRIIHIELIKGIQGRRYDDELLGQSLRTQLMKGSLLTLAEAIKASSKAAFVLMWNHRINLLDVFSEDYVLLTTYGKLQPPLGKHRLKIIEFISVLVTVSSEAAEKELLRLGAVKQIIELFFEYPYNNFLHHHVEQIMASCLESKNSAFVEHLLHDCNLVRKILETERDFILATAPKKPTVPAEGKSSPRIGNIGHITRIANNLFNWEITTATYNHICRVDCHANVLPECNAVENVFQWACW
ncbi:hypothetical protein ACH5RR_015658 [Cinchona calisaya]|uniref:Uncharacterized protein n=1 Tax=Cinchona calisaya TaxID=153742 RepID=A0ABD2ZTT5_9GENT